MYHWVKNFLFGRKIEVRVGTALSSSHPVENGTPQGSVCSPVLFDIMINDIFENVEGSIGRSLYADDGASLDARPKFKISSKENARSN